MNPCPSCTRPVPDGSRFCPSCATPVSELVEDATRTSVPSGTSSVTPSSLPADDARFLPGTLLAEGRYRVIGLIGKGGMGEVYRADDLKLGQPVALKFLPRALDRNESRRLRFLNEVKLARQVSHPNVCRVYDVGEADGQAFLSMEYVDGEDLSSLLRRIGRFPEEKAVPMARQLCAGLAAAHELKILHRDLKPANVLIDGMGRPKITDFGLAGMAESFAGAELLAGTPAYQAPEQRRGESVSVQSDIFSLGLVLHEMLTGERAFSADSIAELDQMQKSSTTSRSTTSLPGFDPAIERVLLRCLEPEPEKRPASALAVAAAFPGGDPLAAAVAAGETPSPELVAAAGEQIEVPRWQPWTALLFVAIGLIPVVIGSGPTMLHNRVDFGMRPAVFEDHAREISEEFGYVEPAETAIGPTLDTEHWRYLVEAGDLEAQKRAIAASTSPFQWWYRASPNNLAPVNPTTFRPTPVDPPWDVEGMFGLTMDSAGHLVDFRGEPTAEEAFDSPREPPAPFDWGAAFGRAGLDLSAFTAVAPDRAPPMYAGEVFAWEGEAPIYPDAKVLVRGASLRGRPVWFQVEPSWELPPLPTGGIVGLLALIALTGTFLAAIFFARRNLRLGRGNRRGAWRLVWVVALWMIVLWALSAYHTAAGFALQLVVRVGLAMLVGGAVWIVYMATEPFVRRRWPDLLVSWARLIEGRWRDPLVGRDLVLGAAFAVALAGLDQLSLLAPTWVGQAQRFEQGLFQAAMLGGRQAAAQLILYMLTFFQVLLCLLVLVLVRVLARRTWPGFLASALVLFMIFASAPQNQGPGMIFLLIFALAVVALLMRFGFVAAVVAMWLHAPLAHGPMSPDLGTWYAGYTIAAIVLLVVVALYGFFISFGGRSVIGEGAWDDA